MWHTLHGWIVVFFGWPNGSIWSNVLSDIGFGAVGYFAGVAKIKKHLTAHHEEQMQKLQEIHEHVKS